jgi:hypothetical protein
MKKPWVEIPRALINPVLSFKFEVKTSKMPSENFPFFNLGVESPSVQPIEIIRHVDASFYLKKSRWDYHVALPNIRSGLQVRYEYQSTGRARPGAALQRL